MVCKMCMANDYREEESIDEVTIQAEVFFLVRQLRCL